MMTASGRLPPVSVLDECLTDVAKLLRLSAQRPHAQTFGKAPYGRHWPRYAVPRGQSARQTALPAPPKRMAKPHFSYCRMTSTSRAPRIEASRAAHLHEYLSVLLSLSSKRTAKIDPYTLQLHQLKAADSFINGFGVLEGLQVAAAELIEGRSDGQIMAGAYHANGRSP